MADFGAPIDVRTGTGRALRWLMISAISLAGLAAILMSGLALHLKLMTIPLLLAVAGALGAYEPPTEGARLTIFPSGRAELCLPDGNSRTVTIEAAHWVSRFGSMVRVRDGRRVLRLPIVALYQGPDKYRRLLVELRHGQ